MRLHGLDKTLELIEALGKEEFDTNQKIHEKTDKVRELADVIKQIASGTAPRGANDMLDPEAFIVKGAVLALAMLSVVRLVLHDFNHLVSDFRRRKRR